MCQQDTAHVILDRGTIDLIGSHVFMLVWVADSSSGDWRPASTARLADLLDSLETAGGEP